MKKVEKIRKIAGADRMEYKLTQKGRDMTNKLVNLNIQILRSVIDNRTMIANTFILVEFLI